MKRKIVSALLVMSMTASLVACGNSGSGSSDPADESVSVSSSASSESDASASASSESEAEAEESESPEGYDLRPAQSSITRHWAISTMHLLLQRKQKRWMRDMP